MRSYILTALSILLLSAQLIMALPAPVVDTIIAAVQIEERELDTRIVIGSGPGK
ncbi:hypothetical protein VTL71DRAFT_6588 [Oculimacula yallundae]|uniref:Uncharacterized protein n=1 Tax=Oculimacula yallundae TaxID=86028 RepID=A0ABR4BY25_9HELO